MRAWVAAATSCVRARRAGSKRDRRAPAGLSVEQRALGDLHREHLLQRHGLGTKLHLVGAVRLGPAALMLHGKGPPNAIRRAMQLDDIGDAGNAQPVGAQRHACHGADAPPHLGLDRVNPLMRDAALGGRGILGPCLLDVDQRALARAEQIVLEGGQGDEISVRRHRRALQILISTVMPAGRSAEFSVTA